MKDIQELVPDEETFRRVWQRVMPDEGLSQIVIRPPAERPPMPPRPAPKPPEGEAGEQAVLGRMLRAVDEGLALAQALRRRGPEGGSLWESLNRSAARLRSAWFLRTGRRWSPRQFPPPREPEPGVLLRRMYLWELDFSRLCRALERDGEDGEELAEGLLDASRRRRRVIRGLLSGR